ncbi:MAG: substrate-binding domain-containing protein [Anaerolineaceae bacterium]
MRGKTWILVGTALVWLLTACQPTATVLPVATLTPIQVQVTPLLQDWLPRLNGCASYLTQSNLLVDTATPTKLDYKTNDLVLRLGEKSSDEAFLSVLGSETITFIHYPKSPAPSLSLDELKQILTGEINNWKDIPSLSEAGITYNQSITVFLPEKDHEVTAWLSKLLLTDATLREDAQRVVSSAILQETVNQTPGGLGLILKAQALPETRLLPVLDEQGQEIDWEQPVLAITQAEPTGDLRQLLLCLQAKTQP